MKIIIALVFIASICSCSKKEPRYVVIGTGDIPAFLDTETREVYSVVTFGDGAPIIYKTSMESAKK